MNCEQPPRSESRLTLADERDTLGQPLPFIDSRLGDAESLTMRAMAGGTSGVSCNNVVGAFAICADSTA